MFALLKDESLLEAYQEALRMELEPSFVELLRIEIESRKQGGSHLHHTTQ
ncbi:sporulation histidine kinase inhibitor Sda [Paenibacillus sp. MER TA 81-3]|nr:sporulation histidine kinase inhibitor Sda [Paenibacillus sp. MER TA 81-3]MCM3339537.1 sporulation histidine kinase inhibitor Sda [Paenibacillus sp. MER TA 81-3]